jgi:hypothetical protein
MKMAGGLKAACASTLVFSAMALPAVFAPAARAVGPRTIQVPSESPTIQAGIDAAVPGDLVVVAPGTYQENIDFRGKDIWLQGYGPGVTTIDGGRRGPTVAITSGETRSAVLRGFTIRGGMTDPRFDSGGGIEIGNASPSILENQITDNRGGRGIGIGIWAGGPLIWANEISYNHPDAPGASGAGGAIFAYHTRGGFPVQIMYNKIFGNAADHGGAIDADDGGVMDISVNSIVGNWAYFEGGAFSESNTTTPTFTANIIAANAAGDGDALFLQPVVTTPASMTGNIVYGNYATTVMGGSGLGASIVDQSMPLAFSHNYLLGEPGHDLIRCQDYPHFASLSFDGDILQVADGGTKTANCTHVTGLP